MKLLKLLTYFTLINVNSCNEIDIYESILKDIKSNKSFVDYKINTGSCDNLKVSGHIYSMCFLGSPFVFDNQDISDYMNEYCFGENAYRTKEYRGLEKLSDVENACLKVSFSETLNNKIIVEVISLNKNINKELLYLYVILPDGSVEKLQEEIFIVN